MNHQNQCLLKKRWKKLINWYNNEFQALHPIERAALLHVIFVGILNHIQQIKMIIL
ncbi:hypothetical protein [Tepidibacter mesophilus]|uniref:hypothetical protein n=1 Tax=Tepidibacter mesophilus TaxID=655607 RepID=UPI0016518D34|nr:hypothetical protein [Tepidibacter mesophilus]